MYVHNARHVFPAFLFLFLFFSSLFTYDIVACASFRHGATSHLRDFISMTDFSLNGTELIFSLQHRCDTMQLLSKRSGEDTEFLQRNVAEI